MQNSEEEFDGWETGGDDPYDADNFYISSRNRHDHSESLTLKLPPDVYAVIMETINSPELPDYRSPQDFIRDAIVHRLHYIATEHTPDDRIEELINMEIAIAMVDQRQRLITARRGVVDRCVEDMDACEKSGDRKLFKRSVESAREAAGFLSEPFRGELTKRVEEYERRL